MLIVFLVFLERQLSTSSEMLCSSVRLINFVIFSAVSFFPFLEKNSILFNSFLKTALSPLHLLIMRLIFDCDKDIFFF